MLTRFLAYLVVVGAAAACSATPRWAGSVEMRDGVEVVSNPSDPILGDARDIVTERWSVQGSNWIDPSAVHIQSGLITVVDPQANQVHLVTSSGEVEASLGRQGGGPGEFLNMRDAFRCGDRLAVLDLGKGGVEYLDLEGNYLFSLRLAGAPWSGFPLENGALLLKGEFQADPAEETLGEWIRVGEGSDPTPFTPQPLESLAEEQGVRCSDIFPWAAGVARLRFTTPEIQVLDRAGDIVMESWIDLPVQEVSRAELDFALSELRRRLAGTGYPPEFQQQNLIVMEERWRVKCRFGPLRFDRSGKVAGMLEQNPDEFGSGNATLHLLSQGGVYLAKVAFPTAWRDFAMADQIVYALVRDPTTDLITLTAYRLDLPNSLLSDAAEALDGARHAASGGR